MTHHDTGETQGTIPEGFDLERQGKDVFIIRYKRTGMGCMNTFLFLWFAGWTVGSIFLLRQYFNGRVVEDGDPSPLWFVMVFLAMGVFLAVWLTYLVFCRKSFRLDSENLIMETDVLGFKRRRLMPRTSIRRLVQVKDGGDGKDSFPSWGLRIEGEQKVTLIFRQPHEKSRWLGKILAQWAGVELSEVPKG